MDRSENCGACLFFSAINAQGGYCRRNPPTPLLKMVQVPSKIGGAPEIGYQIEATFAPTAHNQWCGEFYDLGAGSENETPDDEPA